jgi:hypothetical protein
VCIIIIIITVDNETNTNTHLLFVTNCISYRDLFLHEHSYEMTTAATRYIRRIKKKYELLLGLFSFFMCVDACTMPCQHETDINTHVEKVIEILSTFPVVTYRNEQL